MYDVQKEYEGNPAPVINCFEPSPLTNPLSQGVPLMFPPLAAGGHGTPIALANFLRHLSIAYGNPSGSGAITHSTARQMLGERMSEEGRREAETRS